MAEGDGTGLVATAQAALLDDPAFLRGLVQGALQAILEAEMAAHRGAGRYERTPGRTGHRNGSKPRVLHTRVGTLELRVPQDREGTFSTELFGRYQRSEQGTRGSGAWNCACRRTGRARSRPSSSRATSAVNRRWW